MSRQSMIGFTTSCAEALTKSTRHRDLELGASELTARKWPLMWTKLAPAERQQFISWWAERNVGKVPAACLEWVLADGMLRTRGKRKYKAADGSKQVLLTWQGAFGVLKLSSQPARSDVPSVVEHIAASPEGKGLWARLQCAVAEKAQGAGAEDVALCLELCTQTLSSGLGLRVHAHACLRSGSGLRFRCLDDMEVLGAVPHVVQQRTGRNSRQRATDWSPFYYCCCPKVGSIFQTTSKEPFKDFAVNPDWIWTMLQSDKMDMDVARAQIVRCRKNLCRHLANLDALQKELTAQKLSAEIRAKQEVWDSQRKPFRRVPAVQRFLALAKRPAERRPFLVLDGPSRMGKTQFVMALVPLGGALDVNCSECMGPPLRTFDMGAHSLILFDEGSVAMVLRNRKLFQAPNSLITIGTSPTNQHAYNVYLNNTRLVICSNSWQEQLGQARSVDADWIKANQVYVRVTEPLWVSTDQTKS